MASRVRLSLPSPDATDPVRPLPDLTSDLLEEIFLRVASPADLARASTACVSFRRLISDHAFLRRYRSIHPPLLLGFVTSDGFHPAEAPHPSAAVARAVEFSFDYLPRTAKSRRWHPCDCRNGRVLLKRDALVYWEDLLVCDPLSRRYLMLPPMTEDLLASTGIQNKNIVQWGTSFIRSGGIEDDTSFGVMSWIQSTSRLGVFIYSSGSGCWSLSASISWGDLGLDEIDLLLLDSSECAYDCFYFKVNGMNTLIKLDMISMQFCTIELPPDHDHRQVIIVESGESRIAMFSMIYEGTSVDYYTFSQNGSEKSHEWHLKSTIPLSVRYTCEDYIYIGGPAEGYIFLECLPHGENKTHSTYFSLEIKSLKIARVSRISYHAYGPNPFFGFPPFMSAMRI